MKKRQNIILLAQCILLGIVAFAIVSFPQGWGWLGVTIYFGFWSACITSVVVLLFRAHLQRITRRTSHKLLWSFTLALLVLFIISTLDRYSNDLFQNSVGLAAIGLGLSLYRYRLASKLK